jgi:dipeptidyl aminopeptidase/acylaminoacyl peptidase
MFSLMIALIAILAAPSLALAQQTVDPKITAETFLEPPAEIADAVLAPRHLNVRLGNPSPVGAQFLNVLDDGPPTMAMFAKPFYRLAGLQIDWGANRSRQFTTRAGIGVRITDGQTGETVDVNVPDGAHVSSPAWSPDGQSIAFFVHTTDETHIYVANPASGQSRQVTPHNRRAPPVEPDVPTGPQVRLTTPETNRVRTYPDLLEGPHEKALLEYYGTGQLAVVDVENRSSRTIGQPAMVQSTSVSPDGSHLLVTAMQQPFSYIVPTRQFATKEQILSMADGSVLAVVSENDVNDGSPSDTATASNDRRRNAEWRADGSLGFLQMAARQSDNGNGDANGGQNGRRGRKDRVMQWAAPFDSASITTLYEHDGRLSNARYSEDGQILFLSTQQGDNGHDFAVFLSDTDTTHTLWRGRRARFQRGTPSLLSKTLPTGVSVVRTTGSGETFLSGTHNHDDPMQEGPKSYVDRIDIRSGDTTRVYESDNDGVYESILAVLSDDASQLLVSRESPTDIPDSYVRNVGTGELRQLTQNTDYTPDLTNAVRRRYSVTRADGFEFAVDVTLPQGWQGERLPGMIWFYPREYTSQDRYDEATRDQYNKNAFPNLRSRSMDVLVRRGYAMIEPDSPIIGDNGRMNDNYVHDLRNNLSATIDFLDKEGIIDRERMGVGGHSYGAFSTVNAMVHTPFFKAGIAGDGNFNRTLTPFSFQTERRSIWQSRDLYFSMSPLFYANNLTGSLLLYHGEHDQNVGTFPIHSWRLFESLESLGKTASLYVYPFEDHGPATKETLLDLWARWSVWLDTHVKGDDPDKVTADASAGGF